MASHYGPWAMPIEAGSNPQLGAFWKRRLTMLAPASRTSCTLSRRNRLWLSTAALLVIALPTFCTAPARAGEDGDRKRDREHQKAAAPAGAADQSERMKRPVPALPANGSPTDAPAKSYLIKVRVVDDEGMVLSEPIMVTLEDQEACMEAYSQTPFVVGFDMEKGVKQPRIVVLKEGIAMKATVTGVKSEGAVLDITVEQSKIGNVETKAIAADDSVQLVSLDTHKKRIIDFVKYGEVFRIPLGEKTAKDDGARIELVFGSAGMDVKLPERKSTATEPARDAKEFHR